MELGIEERRQIERLRLARAPVARIAARLRRHRSTIYRELERNRFRDKELPELDGTWDLVAHEMATGRRRRRRRLVRMPGLLVAIADRLRAGGPPEQIAARLRREGGGVCVSHETRLAPGCTPRMAGSAAWPGTFQAGASGAGRATPASRAGPCSRPSARSATVRRPSRAAASSATGKVI